MSEQWTGAAAICVNTNNEILMVLQGQAHEEKKWSVPSGGKHAYESYEECCKREVFEETGYVIELKEMLFVKNQIVHYFLAEVTGGAPSIQDPDELIYEIAWKSAEQIESLELSFEEDRELLIQFLRDGGK
ncbi:NUDIX hydrolase [Paenibacillus sp. KN14-4R]|uniref:NUDIX hydrolase n=1 Tax=Paenibacillus sp. KN14-4R TaxID=3445773 RepID=UPI003F9FC9E8